MTFFPRNVLSVIHSKADLRTKERLRAVDKAAWADSLMPPVKKGYAFGTGKYQKEFNSLPKWYRQTWLLYEHLKTKLPRADYYREIYLTPEESRLTQRFESAFHQFMGAANAVRSGMGLYRSMARKGSLKVEGNRAYAEQLEEAFPGLTPRYQPFTHPNRERFMDELLEYAMRVKRKLEPEMRALERELGAFSNANRSRAVAVAQRQRKRWGEIKASWGPEQRKNKRARQVARRAARRMA